jgi:hypothetical protein
MLRHLAGHADRPAGVTVTGRGNRFERYAPLWLGFPESHAKSAALHSTGQGACGNVATATISGRWARLKPFNKFISTLLPINLMNGMKAMS